MNTDHVAHAVPVFGCMLCIEERDWWTCGYKGNDETYDRRLRSSKRCPKCKRRRPMRDGVA